LAAGTPTAEGRRAGVGRSTASKSGGVMCKPLRRATRVGATVVQTVQLRSRRRIAAGELSLPKKFLNAIAQRSGVLHFALPYN
jgi:hypothetical protein